MNSFSDVIGIWKRKLPALVEAIAANCETAGLDPVGIFAIKNWKARNSIPHDYWRLLISLARAEGVKLTYNQFEQFAAERRKQGRSRQVEAAP